jgi:PAS domain-containing protein
MRAVLLGRSVLGALWNLDAVGAAFSAAAVDPSKWGAAIEAAVAETGSFGAVLVPVRGRTPQQAWVTESFAPAIERYFSEGWVHRDERLRGVPMLEARGVFSDLDFISPDEIARHPYYQEWLAPHDLRWFACVKIAVGDDLWALSIQRTIAQGPFTPKEINRLARLSGSLASAGALARALGFARAEAAIAAFEVSGHAVALLDRLGRVIRVNASAERLLGSDPKIVQGRVTAGDHRVSAALDRAFHALLWSSSGRALTPSSCRGRNSARSLPICSAPRRSARMPSRPVRRSWCSSTLAPGSLRPEEHLRKAFGLTVAEARLASFLASGERLERAADTLGIT